MCNNNPLPANSTAARHSDRSAGSNTTTAYRASSSHTGLASPLPSPPSPSRAARASVSLFVSPCPPPTRHHPRPLIYHSFGLLFHPVLFYRDRGISEATRFPVALSFVPRAHPRRTRARNPSCHSHAYTRQPTVRARRRAARASQVSTKIAASSSGARISR